MDCKLKELTKSSYHKLSYMATHYLIKKKTHSFVTQQLNIFYPCKNSKSLLFSKFPSESLNLSSNFLNCFIIFTSYLILLYLFCNFSFLFIYLLIYILEFACLVTVTFKFTVLYNDIYIYIYIYIYI